MIQIEYLPTSSLNAAPYNPRKMPDEQMARLMRGIEAFGLVDPIIVNQATGNIVGGHQRVEAAKRLKLAQVPVVHVSLDRDQEKALNLALNKISGEWDLDALRDILGDLSGEGFDLDLTGFNADEIAGLLTGAPVPEGDEWGDAMGGLPEGDREPFQQMTFTLHDDQAETVKRAIDAAKSRGEFDGPNENGNGNALARICEDFLGG